MDRVSGPAPYSGNRNMTALDVIQFEQDDRASSKSDVRDLVIVLTGATSGIGLEAARALYHAGARLFITSRDDTHGRKAVQYIEQKLPGQVEKFHSVEIVPMDLNSLSSVEAAAANILDKTDQINVLVNNAGIAAVPFGRTADGFERHWGVNYLAPFLLTHRLLPRLASSSDSATFQSRIINVSSTGHRLFPVRLPDVGDTEASYDAMSAYATSKMANIYHSNYIDHHFSNKGLRSFSLHPGTVPNTQLLRELETQDAVYPEQQEKSKSASSKMKSPEQGAATVVFAAVSPYLNEQGGVYLEDCGFGVEASPTLPPLDGGYSPDAFNIIKEDALWEETCAALHLYTDPFQNGS